MILLIDNYDSFVHNLARYFRRLGQETRVIRYDAIRPDEIRRLGPRAIVLSPGPCTPNEAGCSLDVVRQLAGEVPLLGVCLGHQVIAAALGGRIVRAPAPMHGRASPVFHNVSNLFTKLPSPLRVGRYHSLIVEHDTLPQEISVTARTSEGLIMAIEHRQLPIWGVQFHPESILTQGGFQLLANFIRLAGLSSPENPPTFESECDDTPLPEKPLPATPVTF